MQFPKSSSPWLVWRLCLAGGLPILWNMPFIVPVVALTAASASPPAASLGPESTADNISASAPNSAASLPPSTVSQRTQGPITQNATIPVAAGLAAKSLVAQAPTTSVAAARGTRGRLSAAPVPLATTSAVQAKIGGTGAPAQLTPQLDLPLTALSTVPSRPQAVPLTTMQPKMLVAQASPPLPTAPLPVPAVPLRNGSPGYLPLPPAVGMGQPGFAQSSPSSNSPYLAIPPMTSPQVIGGYLIIPLAPYLQQMGGVPTGALGQPQGASYGPNGYAAPAYPGVYPGFASGQGRFPVNLSGTPVLPYPLPMGGPATSLPLPLSALAPVPSGYAAAGYTAPNYSAPNYSAPNFPAYGAQPYGAQPYGASAYAAQSYGMPNGMPNYYGAPGYGTPSYGTPNLTAQGYPVPNYGAPSYGAPGSAPGSVPGYVPGYPAPGSAVPSYVMPGAAAPGYSAPGYSAPGYSTPVNGFGGYGTQPMSPGVYGTQSYGTQPYGTQQPYGVQPYGVQQPYGAQQPYGVPRPGYGVPQPGQPLALPTVSQVAPSPRNTLLKSSALTDPSLKLQGAMVYQGNDFSGRARLSVSYPLTPKFLFGAAFDLTDGNAFADSKSEGFNVNELYFATSLPDLPNFRIVAGQIDLTSYFDRNSFAKDGTTHFFNSVFQTNPALSASGLSSRPGLLVNWSLTDNIEAKAAVFSSARNLDDLALDGVAAELGVRAGNAIIRGTYVSDRESNNRDSFREAFQLARGDGKFGPIRGDREEGYGINAEVFIPSAKMGVFGRYGRYNNLTLDRGGDTYSFGLSFLDVFSPDDRIGLAYGRDLSNDNLRRQSNLKSPDVLELFYDFKLLPNLRLGFMVQQRNEFSETVAGVRMRTEFDVTPPGKRVQ